MRVAIDIQSTTGKKTGFGSYVLGLLEGFKELKNAPEFVFLKHDKKVSMRTLDRILWDQVEFPIKAKRCRPDLVHKTCFSGAIFYRGPQVITVHDIIPYIFPKNVSWTSRIFWNGLLITSIKMTKIIITASETSKRDLVKLLGVDPARVHVIYHGISNSFRPRETALVRSGIASFCLPDKYFICVGSLEPRKNLPMLVSSYLSVADEIPEDLVIVGKRAWGMNKLDSILEGHRLRARVKFLGYVDDDRLPLLYNAAAALLFPSYYEGFGLPPLEAMACGCPVVCSNVSSVPEVVGDVALMLDPNDGEAWSRAIVEMSKTPETRKVMAENGLERSKKFTWKKCAEETLRVYEKALQVGQ